MMQDDEVTRFREVKGLVGGAFASLLVGVTTAGCTAWLTGVHWDNLWQLPPGGLPGESAPGPWLLSGGIFNQHASIAASLNGIPSS